MALEYSSSDLMVVIAEVAEKSEPALRWFSASFPPHCQDLLDSDHPGL